ncbi:nucleotidyl transferase AbiEii/AbiGii toxin family protein [Streptomyces mirabilis]|uniref:nucleotidyl transferase AbiEii/AbiGii toxin family protein n=2 Tax=Streptomyces mirabilis TaxID=68239 RepID=UPI0036AF78E1
MNLDEVPAHHRRLLTDALELGSEYGLALMGGYAVRAHGLVHRPSQDLDFATVHPAPLQEIITTLTRGLTARGWAITVIDIQPSKPASWPPTPPAATPAKSTCSRKPCGDRPSSSTSAPYSHRRT